MRASYFDPDRGSAVESSVDSLEGVIALLQTVLTLRSPRGHPTLELVRDDGSSLSFSTDGKRALVVWTNSLGESFHSVGGTEDKPMVFDYFGSWSETSGSNLVEIDSATDCLANFLKRGVPDSDRVLFEPD
jgi:hypothetical protein